MLNLYVYREDNSHDNSWNVGDEDEDDEEDSRLDGYF
jgi:hypothetical protein